MKLLQSWIETVKSLQPYLVNRADWYWHAISTGIYGYFSLLIKTMINFFFCIHLFVGILDFYNCIHNCIVFLNFTSKKMDTNPEYNAQ